MVKGKFGQTSKSLTIYGHGCRSFHICYTCLNNYFNNIRCQSCQRSVQVYHELSCITVLLPPFGVQLAMKCQLSFPFAKFKCIMHDCMFSSCQVRVSAWIHTLYLPKCQGTPCSKQTPYLKFKWLKRDSNPQPLRVWIHSETRTWHDENIQSNAPYR